MMIKIGIGLAIFIFILGMAVAFYFKEEKREENSIQKLQSIVLEEIKNVSELATFRKNFKSTLMFETRRNFLILKFLAQAENFQWITWGR